MGENSFICWAARIEVIEECNGQKFNPQLIIGDRVTIGQNLHLICSNHLEIENDVLISSNVLITDCSHEYYDININVLKQPLHRGEVRIGEGSFIGAGVKILEGSVLGSHCVIGANSVVFGNIPSYSVVVGIPGRIVKRYNVETRNWENT